MANPGREMSKPPGSEMCNEELDVIARFADSEKIIRATMEKLFQKYDQPFMNDILINLKDFTYDTPAGSFPREDNDRSPIRTDPRQLSDQEDGGTVAED